MDNDGMEAAMGEPSNSTGKIKASILAQMEMSPARVIAPIDCDEMCYAPPEGLMVAGFPWRAKLGEDGGWEIDENLVDTIVAWSALATSTGSR